MNIAEIVNDFTRRYQNTYVRVKMPGSQEADVFYVDAVNRDDEHGAVLQLSSNEYGSISLNFATGHEILFNFPEVQTFQNGKDSFFFRRVPARQYRRGLCDGNAVFTPCSSLFTGGGSRMDWETVNNAYNPKKYSLKEALEMVGKTHRSVALAGGFSLLTNIVSKSSSHHLLYFDLPVGSVDPSGKIVLLDNSFEEEIGELK